MITFNTILFYLKNKSEQCTVITIDTHAVPQTLETDHVTFFCFIYYYFILYIYIYIYIYDVKKFMMRKTFILGH